MAEIFRHTDEDGDCIELISLNYDPGSLGVLTGRGVAHKAAVCLSEDAGRRLLDALFKFYGSKDSIEEEARGG